MTIAYVLMILGIILLLAALVRGLVQMTFSTNVSGYGSGTSTTVISDNDGLTANPTVLQAQPSTLTTRTTNTAGTLTMTNANHGITTGQRVDLYWTGGKCYGAIVGTVAGNSVPIASVSGGDVLPAATTAINVGICKSTGFSVTGNNVTALNLNPGVGQNSYFVFNNGSADVYAQYIPSGQISFWYTGAVGTNPLAGTTPTLVYMSHDNIGSSVQSMVASALVH